MQMQFEVGSLLSFAPNALPRMSASSYTIRRGPYVARGSQLTFAPIQKPEGVRWRIRIEAIVAIRVRVQEHRSLRIPLRVSQDYPQEVTTAEKDQAMRHGVRFYIDIDTNQDDHLVSYGFQVNA